MRAGDPTGPLRVLIVEDEVLIALELEHLLADLGHRTVGVASTAPTAIALARATAPDLALVDISLADGPTGVEIARALRAEPRTSVVFATANAKRIPEDFVGALGVLAKPYSERAVAATLAYVAALRSGHEPGPAPDGFDLAPGR